MIHLFKGGEHVVQTLARAPSLLLVDYDGTLRETVDDPAAAKLSARRRALLARVAVAPLRLAVMSGRPISTIKNFLGLASAVYCGNFGLEIEDGNWSFLHPRVRDFEERLAFLRDALRLAVGGFQRAVIEDKHWGLVLHYRGVASWRRWELEARLTAIRTERTPAGLRWMRGDFAWEIVPDLNWDKGDAGELLWRRFGKPYIVALGDGFHDEAMFALAQGRGAAICVGRDGGSQAPYWLKDVPEVYRFLAKLADRLETQRDFSARIEPSAVK